MADKDAAKDGDEQASSGGKKKLVLMVVGAVALVGLGMGGTIMFMGGGNEPAEEVAVEESVQEPIFIALDPTFVVNYQDENAQNRFLKAELNVLTFEEEVEDAVTKHMPMIRNNLVMLFNRQVFEDLLQQEGKEVLRAEALAQVQSVIETHLGKPGVEELYFTTFVMQ